jgi:hypothetical protein
MSRGKIVVLEKPKAVNDKIDGIAKVCLARALREALFRWV